MNLNVEKIILDKLIFFFTNIIYSIKQLVIKTIYFIFYIVNHVFVYNISISLHKS